MPVKERSDRPGKWLAYVNVKVDGKHKTLKRTCDSFDEALLAELELLGKKEQKAAEEVRERQPDQCMAQLLDLALSLPKPWGWRDSKSDSQRKNAERLVRIIGTRVHPKEVTEDYLVTLQQTKLTQIPGKQPGTFIGPGQINKYMSALSTMLKIAFSRRWITRMPTFPQRLSIPKRTKFTIRPEWEEMALERLRHQGHYLEVDLYLFLVATSCRIGEALKLTYSDVDLDGNRLTFRDTKTGEDRTIVIPNSVKPRLGAWKEYGLTYMGGKYADRVWPIGYRRFHDNHMDAKDFVVDSLSLGEHVREAWVTHTLRKTGLTRYASGQQGSGAAWTGLQLKSLSGHKTLAMVEHYVNDAAIEMETLMNG